MLGICVRSTLPTGGTPSAEEISYDYWGGVRPSAAQRSARPAGQPAFGSEQGYPQQVSSSVFLNCKMWLNDAWDWEGQCRTWISLMPQHVCVLENPFNHFLLSGSCVLSRLCAVCLLVLRWCRPSRMPSLMGELEVAGN